MEKPIKNLAFVMIISLVIASLWNRVLFIKQFIHYLLDPTAGRLLDWHANFGMLIFSALIGLFIILIQKYTTDQETLREIKKEQKILQLEMKKYREDPKKLMELQKKQLSFLPKTMEITMRPLMYTSLPIILFFRWFNDYFLETGTKIFGMNWFLAYLISSIIFTTIFRKVFKVA